MPLRLVESSAFRGHEVDHATRLGLSQLSNGQLHDLAQIEYGLLVTSDRHFHRKAELAPTETMGVIYVRISPNVLELIQHAIEELARNTNLEDLVGKRTVLRRDGWDVT